MQEKQIQCVLNIGIILKGIHCDSSNGPLYEKGEG